MLGRIAAVATVVLTIAYPFVVYIGLRRFRVRQLAVVLVAMLVATALLRARELDRTRLRGVIVPLAPTVVLAMVAGALDRQWALLLVPVIVNLGLLATFAAGLRASRTTRRTRRQPRRATVFSKCWRSASLTTLARPWKRWTISMRDLSASRLFAQEVPPDVAMRPRLHPTDGSERVESSGRGQVAVGEFGLIARRG
ncbi:MAG: hypothetical protein IAG13_21605 [Deltaproteobacteria bacterium]|nr:hypothetical protein [Nannocystaceae bacterium]